MRFKYFSLLLGLFLFFPNLFAQNNLFDFNTITSKGDLPQEFYTYLSPQNDVEPKMKTLFSSGFIIYGSPLNQYLNSIKETLLNEYPELQTKIKIFVYRSTYPNLFSDSNIVVVNLGLIAKVQNESELAFFIAHEISHIILKHHRKFSKNSSEYQQNIGDLTNEYHYRSESQELEADQFALDSLFLNSGYNIEDISGSFYLLGNPKCNYSEQVFNKAFFETPYYTFSSNYYLQTIYSNDDANSNSENQENKQKTYASKIFAKRKLQFNQWIDSKKQNQGSSFIQSDSLFNFIRNLARFESINIDLTFYNFNDLMYNLAVLIHQFPDNPFLNQACIAAHYNYFIERLYSDKISLLNNYKDVEGNKQFYHFFYNKISRDELGLLTLRYAWQAHNAYPNNSYFYQVAMSIVKILHEKNRLNYNDYSDYPMNFDVSTLENDTTSLTTKEVPKNKYSRIKSKSFAKVIPTTKFNTLNYMLVELRQDTLFMDLIEDGLKRYEDEKIMGAITEKQYQNLVSDFNVVNPTCIKSKKNNTIEINKNEVVIKPISNSLSKLKMKNSIISLTNLNTFNEEKYNHFTKIQLYFYNFSLANTYNFIYYQSIGIKPTCDYFGSENVNFVGASFKHNRNRIYKRLYFVPFLFFNPITSPFTLAHMSARTSDVKAYFIIVNVVDSRIEFVNTITASDYNWKPILSQFIYNNYYNISKKMKGVNDEK